MKVAVPVETEDGLNSIRAKSFGTAPCFVVAEFEGSAIVGGGIFDNVSHDEFGCAGVAEYVHGALGADVVVTHEISGDALAYLAGAGVAVYREADEPTAAGALRRYLQGQCARIDAE